jgi:cytochrome c biogenesis protein CcmG/thiol:disulfide interchange protein DsbE
MWTMKGRLSMGRMAIAVALVFAAVMLAGGCGQSMTPAGQDGAAPGAMTPASLVGKAAPEIDAGYWLNTTPLTLAALRGKVVVIEFWATWCVPCKDAIPHLVALQQKYGPQGLVILGMTPDVREKAVPFAAQMGMTYALGGGGNTFHNYFVSEIPKAFIIDKGGKIIFAGNPVGDAPKMEAMIAGELKRPMAPAKS